jgi:hypothetical protein
MADSAGRVTPVQAAKILGIRPQIIYGWVKHNRIGTYANMAGKAPLVDLDDARRLMAGTQHHRPKDPETGKPIKPRASDSGLAAGSLLSYHARMPKERKPRAHRVATVTEVVQNDEGEDALVRITKGDNSTMTWEIGYITDKIAKQACMIEPAANILAVLMFHFIHSEQPELAASLQAWCEINGISYGEVTA